MGIDDDGIHLQFLFLGKEENWERKYVNFIKPKGPQWETV